MNDDDRLMLDARTWLKDEDVVVPDPEEAGRRVAAQLARTRQLRRRWWPLPSFKDASVPPLTIPGTQFQPAPIPATNGHSPTVSGRTKSMFSPVKAIIAGAVVFALGGAFLIAPPFDQQGSVPEAETEAIAPTWVTGTVERAPSCSGPDSVEIDGDVRHDRNVECSPQTWTSSESRLTSEVVRRWNSDVFQTDEGTIEVGTGTAFLRNEGGGWACSEDTYLTGGSGTSAEPVPETTTFTCIGDGGYEGLSAILVSEMGPNYSEEFVGLIFSGDFPPPPEPPAAE
jgi:hypothetical protein